MLRDSHTSLHTYSSVAKRDSQPTSLLGVRCGSRPTFVYILWVVCASSCKQHLCWQRVCVPLCLLLLAVACWLLAFGGKTPSTHAQNTCSTAAADQVGTGNGPNTPREQHLRPRADHFWTRLFPTFDPLSPPILTHFRRFAAKSRKRRESRTFGGICRISLPTTTVGVESGAGKC